MKQRSRTFQKALGCVKSALQELSSLEVPSSEPVQRELRPRQFFAGVSGGADSLALAATLSISTPNTSAIIVDHGLQTGSKEVAQKAQKQCESLGLSARVKQANLMPGANLEARARDARYTLLQEDMRINDVLFLAHTLNDQAENVLLGLVRGSGLSALHGMKRVAKVSVKSGDDTYRNIYVVRPFLGMYRHEMEEICRAQNLSWWNDPTNTVEELSAHPAFNPSVIPIISQYPLRSQVRTFLMPTFEALTPGVQKNLARTAELSRLDDDFLWRLADDALEELCDEALHGEEALPLPSLRELDTALRYRVLALWLGHPTLERVQEIDNALIGVKGVGGRVVELEGRVKVMRKNGKLSKVLP